jgi:uncharacterized protein
MLVTQIKSDMVSAMKARDSIRVQCLRMAMAAFTNELVAKGMKPTEVLDDASVLAVLKRLGKQRKEAAEQFEKGGRADMAANERAELAIIESYLPQLMSREDIEKVARAVKDKLGVTDASGAGKLTGAIMKELNGQADGADVKAVVARLF